MKNYAMKNDPDEARIPYGAYRGTTTAQPLDAPNDLRESSVESHLTSSEGEYQQQEQLYGFQQPYLAPSTGYINPYERSSMRMRAPAAAWLSYLGGWVTGLIFLLLRKENRFVRFHAMQSFIFFGAIGLMMTVFSHISFLDSISTGLGFVSFICWIVLIAKAARGKYYKLPIIGDYAEKWANSLPK